MYKDEFKFTEDKILQINKLFKDNNIIYAQLFGSYLDNKESGTYNDIDICVYTKKNNDLIDDETIKKKMFEILNCDCHMVEIDYMQNYIKKSIVTGLNILYLDDNFESIIWDKIEKISIWNMFEFPMIEKNRSEVYMVGRSILHEE